MVPGLIYGSPAYFEKNRFFSMICPSFFKYVITYPSVR
jgi:hypothetical protein